MALTNDDKALVEHVINMTGKTGDKPLPYINPTSALYPTYELWVGQNYVLNMVVLLYGADGDRVTKALLFVDTIEVPARKAYVRRLQDQIDMERSILEIADRVRTHDGLDPPEF